MRLFPAACALLLLAGLPPAQARVYTYAAFELQGETLFRGIQRAGPSVQAALDLGYERSYAGFWAARASRGDPWDADELDVYAGATRQLSPLFTLDAGTIFYDIDAPRGRPAEDAWEAYLGLALEYRFRPTAYVYYDLRNNRWTLEGAAGQPLELDLPGELELSWRAYAGASFAGDPDDPSWSYAGGGLKLALPLNDAFEAALSAQTSWRDRAMQAPKTAHAWLALSFSAQF